MCSFGPGGEGKCKYRSASLLELFLMPKVQLLTCILFQLLFLECNTVSLQ